MKLREIEIDILLNSLGEKGKASYKKSEAQTQVENHIRAIQNHYGLNGDNLILLRDAVLEIVTQLGDQIDYRACGPLLEHRRQEYRNQQLSEYHGWATKEWKRICDEYETAQSKQIRIKLPKIGTLIPAAVSGQDSKLLTDWVTFPFNDGSGAVGRVFSTSKSCVEEVQKWRHELQDSAFTHIDLAWSVGAGWDCLIFNPNTMERNFETLCDYITRMLRSRVQLDGELPRRVVIRAPGDCWLSGITSDEHGIKTFGPAYIVELTDEIREEIKV